MAVPNPYSYLRLVDEVAAEWATLSVHWDQSTMSVSRPRVSTTNKGISDNTSFRVREQRRLTAATRSRYRLRTDIAQCYGSIYTHSLSWALASKAAAKANLNDTSFPGATLDQLLREAQDGQTIGLPVGPESSLAAAEIILCAVDQRLQDQYVPWVDAFRAIDDYEIFVRTRSDAEATLHQLEAQLAHFELGLNASKTVIDVAPFLIEAPWKSRLTSLMPLGSRIRTVQIRAYVNEVFALAREHPNDPVVNYALRVAESFETSTAGHKLLVDAALATLRFSAPSIKFALLSIMNRLERLELDRAPLWSCLNELVTEAAKFEHSYEVTWGLWALLVSGGQLDESASAAVAGMEDPFSLVAYMRLSDLGRATGPTPPRLERLASETLSETSDAWVLAHEANVRGWADPGSIKSSPFFDRLRELGVTFVNDDVSPLELPDEEDTFDPSDFDLADLTWLEALYE